MRSCFAVPKQLSLFIMLSKGSRSLPGNKQMESTWAKGGPCPPIGKGQIFGRGLSEQENNVSLVENAEFC